MVTGYAVHSIWSDPGDHAARLMDLPADPIRFAGALEGTVLGAAADALCERPLA